MSGDFSIHYDIDKKAQFKGTSANLAQHLKLHMEYPDIAKRSGVEDNVVMSFVVSKHGQIIYLNIDQEPSTINEEISVELQKAAFKAVKSTNGMWMPAEKDGKYVVSKMILPIEFKLDK